MIRRRPFDDESDNPDRWLVSYADFITLLFAFFVVMYAISSVNQGKYTQLTNSIGTAFSSDKSNPQSVNSTGSDSPFKGQQSSFIKPLPLSHKYYEKIRRERESMTRMGVDLSRTLAPLIDQGKVRIVQNNRGIRIDIHDSLLFTPGSAELSDAAAGIMGEISEQLKGNERLIQVEGHTDNIPIHNAAFFSNWELSAVRASSVVRMINADGIPENRLSALGFGSAQPINENDTPLGRAKNRRVSIMILYETAAQDTSSQEITPAKPAQPN
ncbi:MAG: flagellar motor protein MotD [Pseudomonadota bacterium]